MEKTILKICMSKGFLLDKEMLEIFSELKEAEAQEIIETLGSLKIEERVITKKLFSENFERLKSVFIKTKNKFFIERFSLNLGYESFEIPLDNSSNESREEFGILKVLSSPAFLPKKIEVKDFVNHYRSRYEFMKKILESNDFENMTSIRKIGNDRGTYTIIAAVSDKKITKNKNIILSVEDLTGVTNVLINQNKKEVFEKAQNLLVDDIVAFNGSGSRDMLFINDIIFPELSLQEKKKGAEEEWVAFCSDLHVGSTMFLEENFMKFIKWINGEEGDERQRAIAKKVKYLFLIGDNVDGVGIFPGQERLLKFKDMKDQYKKMASILKLIRDDVKIIICPGQHDAVWVGEPQPVIGEEWAPDLHRMDNVTLVANPSTIEIDFGFKILMYHGASITQFIDEIPYIRLNYGHNAPTTVVKEMVKRRHLAPIHGSVDYIPCSRDDLAIREVPDILATGDQHRSEVSSYNNILLIASSCWQSITPFEEKVGNNPDPCKVPIFNLKTREIKILDFSNLSEMDENKCEEKKGEVVCNLENKCEEKINKNG